MLLMNAQQNLQADHFVKHGADVGVLLLPDQLVQILMSVRDLSGKEQHGPAVEHPEEKKR